MMVATTVLFAACNDDSTDPINGGDDNKKFTEEFVLENIQWELENGDLPNPAQRDKYERMSFFVDEELNYTWTWKGKPGTETLIFKGLVSYNESQFTHDNGRPISYITITVYTINGRDLPGAFVGLFTADDNGNLLLNVEPEVMNWGTYPDPSEGVGSGTSGDESVYPFHRKDS